MRNIQPHLEKMKKTYRVDIPYMRYYLADSGMSRSGMLDRRLHQWRYLQSTENRGYMK